MKKTQTNAFKIKKNIAKQYKKAEKDYKRYYKEAFTIVATDVATTTKVNKAKQQFNTVMDELTVLKTPYIKFLEKENKKLKKKIKKLEKHAKKVKKMSKK